MSVAMVWLPKIRIWFNLAHAMSIDEGKTMEGKTALGIRMPTGHTLNILDEGDQRILIEACIRHHIGSKVNLASVHLAPKFDDA